MNAQQMTLQHHRQWSCNAPSHVDRLYAVAGHPPPQLSTNWQLLTCHVPSCPRPPPASLAAYCIHTSTDLAGLRACLGDISSITNMMRYQGFDPDNVTFNDIRRNFKCVPAAQGTGVYPRLL